MLCEISKGIGLKDLDLAFDSAWSTGCQFCGGKPSSGSASWMSGGSDSSHVRVMCEACAGEYFRYIKEKLPGFGNPDITDEQIIKLCESEVGEVVRDAEKHMKNWVARRGFGQS
jgi:hypothetical protein